MLYKDKVDVCSENHIEHKKAMRATCTLEVKPDNQQKVLKG